MSRATERPLGFGAAMAVAAGGAVLYGLANWLSGKYYLPGCSFSELRPQIVLPMFLGVWLGPLAGFASGCVGDAFGYFVAGKGMAHAPWWSLANGLMGAISGLAVLIGARTVDSARALVRLLALLLAAVALPFGFASAMTYWAGGMPGGYAFYLLFLPIVITDALWALLLMPPLLRAAGLLAVRIEMRMILTAYYLTIVAVMATWLAGILASMGEELRPQQLYTLGALTLLVLLLALAIGGVSARRVVAPVVALSNAARRVGGGDYARIDELARIAARPDELGALAADFGRMVRAVEHREKTLRQEVCELRIEIDRRKQGEDLKRITGSEYFKDLKNRAGALRRQASDPASKDEPT